ncbi:MAG TPA: oligopeptide/dipeptide ABC transporter ATP-binding protein, partial [Rariglobus sp.]
TAPTREIFNAPRHPYTKALQRCVPALQEKGRPLFTIPGLPPDLSKPISEAELMARFDFPPESTPQEGAAVPVARNFETAGTILEVRDVSTHFPGRAAGLFGKPTAAVRAVDGVSLEIKRGEVIGLVGESGSGKSTLGRTIMQLVPPTAGTVVLEGKNLTGGSAAEIAAVRRDLQMVFQDPFASLNPRMTIFATLAEPLVAHRICPSAEVTPRVVELMRQVGLHPRDMQKYPHEFSGGQRQRIAIARALALNPKVIVADEPVSALDVSIQAQILNLLADLVRRLDLTLIFISHDLSVVKHISDRIAVMYHGKIVELGPALDVMEHPQHAYTRTLLGAIPRIER